MTARLEIPYGTASVAAPPSNPRRETEIGSSAEATNWERRFWPNHSQGAQKKLSLVEFGF